MPPTETEVRVLGRRIIAARSRLLSDHGFYGLLLMHMKYAVGDEYDTAWVSADTITFNPDFAAKLDADEICFVLQHEVLHAALGHLSRQGERDHYLWNLATDIVVNSNIMHSHGDDLASITVACEGGPSWHMAPDGSEGWLHTAEEVYDQLVREREQREQEKGRNDSGAPDTKGRSEGAGGGGGGHASRGHWDVHIFCEGDTGTTGIAGAHGKGNAAELEEAWVRWVAEAVASMRVRDPDDMRGLVPACAERLLGELRAARADWRLFLGEFVQEEVTDYSLTTPDRRQAFSPFVLPAFAATDEAVRDVLFAVDASGSVDDRDLTAAFSEIVGACDQFEGRLSGWVCFFDAVPYEPERFEDTDDVLNMRPKGGGGTRFEAVFECVERWLDFDELSSIVVLTDGYAPTPNEAIARGVPVLWLIAGDGPDPAWGRVARL